MKKTELIYYCDKCKKRIDEKEMKTKIDGPYYYELCEKCSYEYEDYIIQVNKYQEAIDDLQKKYKFGKYIFENPKIHDILNM